MLERHSVNGKGVWRSYDAKKIPGTARVPTVELKRSFSNTTGLLGLDLGSGSGRSIGILKKELGCQLVALDLNKEGLMNTDNTGHRVLGDATAVPFGDNTFDFVNLTALMTNLTHPNVETAIEIRECVAREVYRTLKLGGIAAISDFSTTSEKSGTITNYHGHSLITGEYGTTVGFNPICPIPFEVMTDDQILRYAAEHKIDRFTHHYSPEEMVDIFSNAGFHISRVFIENGISPSGNQRDALILLAVKA